MTDLAGVVQELRKERDQAAKQVGRLDAALAALDGVSRGKITGTRSRLSPAAREEEGVICRRSEENCRSPEKTVGKDQSCAEEVSLAIQRSKT